MLFGASQIDISPTKPIALAGYAARWGKLSTDVHDPIYAKAFYFANEDTSFVMLFADVEGLKKDLISEVRARLKTELNIENSSFSATHNHSAPHTYPQVQLEKEEMDYLWVEKLKNSLFKVAQQAKDNAVPAKIGYTNIKVDDVAKNRREGHDTIDPNLSVLLVENKKAVPIGILITYSCHCTVLDGNSFSVSSDYPGYLYEKAKKDYPQAVLAFTNGSAGDTNIGYSATASALGEGMSIRSFSNAKKIADKLYKKLRLAIENIKTTDTADLKYFSLQIELPLKSQLPNIQQEKKAIKNLNKMIMNADPDQKRDLQLERIFRQCVVLRMAEVTDGQKSIQTEVVFITLNKRLYITIPGEIFAETGLYLKDQLNKYFDPVILGYSNDYIGYMPSQSAMKEGGYESETSIFDTNVTFELCSQILSFVKEVLL